MCLFFFFSSRRRHTRYWRDWSSDVCSSDLASPFRFLPFVPACRRCVVVVRARPPFSGRPVDRKRHSGRAPRSVRSEERRVGKSVDLGGRRIIKKKKNTERESLVTTDYIHVV